MRNDKIKDLLAKPSKEETLQNLYDIKSSYQIIPKF